MDEASRIELARLVAIAAIGKAQIEASPLPHLERAASRIAELERAIEDALGMLHGLDDFDMWTDQGSPLPGPPLKGYVPGTEPTGL